MIPHEWLIQAAGRLHHGEDKEQFVKLTPVTFDPELQVYYKWESHQPTGSFKVRGAFNKILSLGPWEQSRGFITVSAGNHGQGVALAARQLGVPALIFCPETTPSTKLDAIRHYGAEIRLIEGGYGNAERTGLAFAKESQAVWVSPYNDGQVIAGQGTIGIELIEQIKPFDPKVVVFPVGGGGLASGISAALAQAADQGKIRMPQLVGVQAENSPFMHSLFYRGTQEGVVDLESLADGLTGEVEEGSLTIPMIRRYLDDLILVSEDEIKHAIAFAWKRYQEKIEGSASASLAAVLQGKIKERPAVVIISGKNIPDSLHAQICQNAIYR